MKYLWQVRYGDVMHGPFNSLEETHADANGCDEVPNGTTCAVWATRPARKSDAKLFRGQERDDGSIVDTKKHGWHRDCIVPTDRITGNFIKNNDKTPKLQEPLIPKKFYMSGLHPTASNVGELKTLLSELPDDLPVCDGWGGAPEVIVYNHGASDQHLQLCEAEEED
jgi:hypothetical protein